MVGSTAVDLVVWITAGAIETIQERYLHWANYLVENMIPDASQAAPMSWTSTPRHIYDTFATRKCWPALRFLQRLRLRYTVSGFHLASSDSSSAGEFDRDTPPLVSCLSQRITLSVINLAGEGSVGTVWRVKYGDLPLTLKISITGYEEMVTKEWEDLQSVIGRRGLPIPEYYGCYHAAGRVAILMEDCGTPLQYEVDEIPASEILL